MDSLYAMHKRQADSIRKEIGRLEQVLSNLKQRSKTEIDQTLQDIQRLDNPAQLQKKLDPITKIFLRRFAEAMNGLLSEDESQYF